MTPWTTDDTNTARRAVTHLLELAGQGTHPSTIDAWLSELQRNHPADNVRRACRQIHNARTQAVTQGRHPTRIDAAVLTAACQAIPRPPAETCTRCEHGWIHTDDLTVTPCECTR